MPGVALQVRKREVGLLSRSVGSLEFRERLGELRTVRLRLHVLVTDQRCKRQVKVVRLSGLSSGRLFL